MGCKAVRSMNSFGESVSRILISMGYFKHRLLKEVFSKNYSLRDDREKKLNFLADVEESRNDLM